MADSLFTKIISGEMACHKVYEDEHVFAFLDIFPLSEGHTLVIPKEPAQTLDQLSDRAAEALGRALPKICRAVKLATGVNDYNVLQNNGPLAHQAIFHVHFHIIPKPSQREGLEMTWRPESLSQAAGQALASRIQESMGK